MRGSKAERLDERASKRIHKKARGGGFVEALLLTALIGMVAITAIRMAGVRVADDMCRPIQAFQQANNREVHWSVALKCCAIDLGFGPSCIS